MTALLLSTVGISVHQIYCYCAGKTTFSLFDEASGACTADRSAVVESCCKKDLPACCEQDNACGPADDHDCTSKTVKVYILKTEFLTVQPLDKLFDYPLWADEFPEYLKMFRPVVCEAANTNKAPPESPPPSPSGRQICLRHQLFRC